MAKEEKGIEEGKDEPEETPGESEAGEKEEKPVEEAAAEVKLKPEEAPAWFEAFAKKQDERFTDLEGRLGEPEEEVVEKQPFADLKGDDVITVDQMKQMIAEASGEAANARAEQAIFDYAKTVLVAEYPDIVTTDPKTGREVINPKYHDSVINFINAGPPEQKFEAILRKLHPVGGKPKPKPLPEDEVTLDSPHPGSEPASPSYKDARNLDEVGKLLDKGG